MLKLEHVKKTFNKGSANEVILYRDLNVEIHDGEFVTIIGSNGSGKSTFFNVISGNIRQDAGSVSFNGKGGGILDHDSFSIPVRPNGMDHSIPMVCQSGKKECQ